ncbi:MAG: polysaccharide deacetylase family protein [Clostridia bacterium]|nr:polysaccharide deacetylase family protein [Clostridia bacterium]
MFRIFRFSQLAIISLFLCGIMLTGACLNAVSPFVSAMSQPRATVPIIMYHQVHQGTKSCGDYIIPLSTPRGDFEYMKSNGITPVSFSALRDYVENGTPLPPRPIVITFDDGERSFLTRVVPLLQEYGYPANVNVIGSLVELYTQNGETDDSYAYLSRNDIKLLSENPLVEIGCHTYNLHSLTGRRGVAQLYGESDDEYCSLISADLDKFNELLVDVTGRAPTIFAYPYGIKNRLCDEILKERGFTITLTCREGVNTLTHGSTLSDLGRFNRPYGISTKEFFNNIFNSI